MKQPHFINEEMTKSLNDLSENMRILKLPKTMSNQFFYDLAEGDTCICGQAIGQEEKEIIINNASNYLADDQIGVMNSIKDTIRELAYSSTIYDDVDNLTTVFTEREDISSELRRLKTRLEDSGLNELSELDERRKEINVRLGEIKGELKDLTSNGNDSSLSWTNNIPKCEDDLNEAIRNIENITQTVALSKRVAKAKYYLKEIERRTLIKLKQRIITESNRKIEKVLPNELIQIEGIDGSLKLKGKTGASVGQTLGIAYSFIGSLFESSLFEFPFVIDSPSLALDLEVRRGVSEILPQLFKQVVLLVISSEVSGFCETFYEKPSGQVQYITVRKPKSSDNAEIWYDKDIFMAFQQENDENEE